MENIDKMINDVIASFRMDNINISRNIIVDSRNRMLFNQQKNIMQKRLSKKGDERK